MKRTFIILGVLALLLMITVPIASWLGEGQFAEQTQSAFKELEAGLSPQADGFSSQDLARLPAPARRALSRLLPASGRRVSLVLLEQTGRIKVTEDASWDHFQARQLISSHPPQMVWAGQAEYLPSVPLMILQTWTGGHAKLVSALWGSLSFFRRQGREMQEYLMLRWLGEALWHPDALLSQGVRWEEGPALSPELKQARVSLKVGDLTVGGRFVFDPRSGVPFYFWGDPRPSGEVWYAKYSDWRRVEGFVIPFQVTEGLRKTMFYEPRLEIQLTKVSYR